MTRVALALALTLSLAGCAASNARGGNRVSWTPPAQDHTYRTPEEASRAYETVQMLAGARQVRYKGEGHWEILENGVAVREVVIGGQANIEWDPKAAQ